MKYKQQNRISNSLLGGLLMLIVLMSVSHVWAKDPVPKLRFGVVNAPYGAAVTLPVGYQFPLVAQDHDGASGLPLKYRYLVKEAVVDGDIISTRYSYEQHQDQLVAYDDPQWSEWIDFRLENEEMPLIAAPDLDEGTYYIIAAQVLDADGAVSMDLEYNRTVMNFRVLSGVFSPTIEMSEEYLGSSISDRQTDIASGQTLNFQLRASAAEYSGTISSLRYGWDVMDPDDPDDPGWGVPAGIAEDQMVVPERIFEVGMHTMTCQAVDSYGASRTIVWYLTVIPFVSPQYQYSLLFIDQVIDSNSGRWPSPDGSIAYDEEQYRNDYWQFLDGESGVSGFSWQRDHRNDTESVGFADIVQYKTVLVNARAHPNQLMFQEFRPQNGQDRYVWLAPYQAQGGNLFMVGDRSMESFLEDQNYMVPLVFDTDESYYTLDYESYVVGFGSAEAPDGTIYNRGIRRYPFQTAGLSLLDWSVPINKNICGRSDPAHEDRSSTCSGLKAMVLSDSFRSQHQIDGLAMSDTLHTNSVIDWRDAVSDSLAVEFPFTGDEFVDANISSRTTPWAAQECADGVNGLCVEPMFTGVSRFDMLREKRWAEGDTGWPGSQYSSNELDDVCGEMALTNLETQGGMILNGTARANGQTYGYLSYKNVADKPGGKADVYWGFDPYRFDQEESKKSIRWVLEYFGLPMDR